MVGLTAEQSTGRTRIKEHSRTPERLSSVADQLTVRAIVLLLHRYVSVEYNDFIFCQNFIIHCERQMIEMRLSPNRSAVVVVDCRLLSHFTPFL